jgi:hypothetical protein
MSQTARTGDVPYVPQSSGLQNVQPTGMTAWVGWIAFAGLMMVMVGSFHMIQGLVALFNDEYYLVGKSGLTVQLDFTAWGWLHVIGGIVVVAAGFALFTGQIWARTVGVLVAMISAVVNIGFLSAYPIWSALMIGIDVLVIWALTVHGGELREQ